MPSDNASRDNNPLPSVSPPAPSPADSVSNGSTSGRKRRASGTGSRGVANLTPDQLAKKRANDREAQRAIRERTKNQIDSLERTIRELRSQQPYQELQRVIRQKEAVEAENSEIKRRLASVLSIIQPLIGSHAQDVIIPPYREPVPPQSSPNSQTHLVPSSGQLNPPATSSFVESSIQQNPPTNASTPSISPHAAWAAQLSAAAPISSQSPGSYVPEHTAPQRHGSGAGIGLAPPATQRHGFTFYPDNRQEIHNGRPQQSEIDRAGPALPANSHITLSTSGPQSPTRARSIHNHDNTLPAYLARPIHIPATCPLDGLLLEFFRERSQYAAAGHSEADVIGPAYPAFCCSFRPERGIYSHPLSRFLTDILSTFPDLSEPPVKVAVLYIMFLSIRWHICPNRENYDRLPEWIRPTRNQVYTPHPAWIDSLPWPKMRDKICLMENPIPLDIFFIPFTRTLSLNWPYEPMEVVLQGQLSDELVLNPTFERHLRDLNNWSLGPVFARAFPELVETTRIKDDGQASSG